VTYCKVTLLLSDIGLSAFFDVVCHLILLRDFSDNSTSSHLVTKKEELGKGNNEFYLAKCLCSFFEGIFNIP
jgi:hypothetical protein